MNTDMIVSSHISRSEARKNKKPGQKIIKAGLFSNGSFGLYKPGYHVKPVLINVWHIIQNPHNNSK